MNSNKPCTELTSNINLLLLSSRASFCFLDAITISSSSQPKSLFLFSDTPTYLSPFNPPFVFSHASFSLFIPFSSFIFQPVLITTSLLLLKSIEIPLALTTSQGCRASLIVQTPFCGGTAVGESGLLAALVVLFSALHRHDD